MPERTGVTVVLHAWRWPDAATLAPRLEALRTGCSPLGPVQVVEARERPEAAVGAAALVNAAVGRSTRPLLVVATPDLAWSAGQVSRVAAAASGGLAVANAGLWAVPRAVFEALGGLDERYWSVGEVDDLAARARLANVRVEALAETAPAMEPEAYPLKAEVRTFLRIRNRLLTVFKTVPPAALGPQVIPAIDAAIVAAHRASGLDAASFAFGRTEAPTAADLADARGALAPLLALDSLVTEVTGTPAR